jgi:hypothetical protein
VTPEQIRMARHALGLDDEIPRKSYRNHYAAAVGSPQEAAWGDLVKQKYAVKGKRNPNSATVGFCLTECAVEFLKPGESLDEEDFR